ncbi:MAG: carbon monoxide dehydrogenase beta subunit family protein [Bacillota bacterium]|jgi:acetyl-CoA decarbonylase/synthase complex subunit epsilon
MPRESLFVPYYKVNVLTGTKSAEIIEDPVEAAEIISQSKNPLYIIGPHACTTSYNDGLLLEYVVKIAEAVNIPTCGTAHVKKKLLEFGKKADTYYDIIEIIHFLKFPDWQGVRGYGPHDLVLFTGIRCDLAEAGLSTLRHYAPHLKTFAICRAGHPHSDYNSIVTGKASEFEEWLKGVVKALS